MTALALLVLCYGVWLMFRSLQAIRLSQLRLQTATTSAKVSLALGSFVTLTSTLFLVAWLHVAPFH